MKIPLTLFAAVALVSIAGRAPAEEGGFLNFGRFLNVAILEMPDRFLADVPLEERGQFLVLLSQCTQTLRLDYANGFLHYYVDGAAAHDRPRGSSPFWLKLLPQENGEFLIFGHLAKPLLGGALAADNTFVLQRDGGKWKDVTASVIPEDIDLTMHFRPRRSSNVIQVAPYERTKRKEGSGFSPYGPRKLDLVWEDGKFRIQKPDSPKLHGDYIQGDKVKRGSK